MEQEVRLFGTGEFSDCHETWHMPSLRPSGDYKDTGSDFTKPEVISWNRNGPHGPGSETPGDRGIVLLSRNLAQAYSDTWRRV